MIAPQTLIAEDLAFLGQVDGLKTAVQESDLKATGCIQFNPEEMLIVLRSLIQQGAKPGANFLDLGAGLGLQVAIAAYLGLNARGIELNPVLAAEAARRINHLRETGFISQGVTCEVVEGSYYPRDYIHLRASQRTLATMYEPLSHRKVFFPVAYRGEDSNLTSMLASADLVFFFSWPEQAPSVFEVFSRYAKNSATLIEPNDRPYDPKLFAELGLNHKLTSPILGHTIRIVNKHQVEV